MKILKDWFRRLINDSEQTAARQSYIIGKNCPIPRPLDLVVGNLYYGSIEGNNEADYETKVLEFIGTIPRQQQIFSHLPHYCRILRRLAVHTRQQNSDTSWCIMRSIGNTKCYYSNTSIRLYQVFIHGIGTPIHADIEQLATNGYWNDITSHNQYFGMSWPGLISKLKKEINNAIQRKNNQEYYRMIDNLIACDNLQDIDPELNDLRTAMYVFKLCDSEPVERCSPPDGDLYYICSLFDLISINIRDKNITKTRVLCAKVDTNHSHVEAGEDNMFTHLRWFDHDKIPSDYIALESGGKTRFIRNIDNS